MPNGATSWLTVQQASQKSGLSAEYVRRLCRQGKLRCERLAGAVLIDPESLTAYLQEMRRLGSDKFNWRR